MLVTEADFRNVLLRHAKHPLHTGETSHFSKQGQCRNPLCGDFVAVGLELEGDKILKIRIQPTGCGISIASASLMSEFIAGRSTGEALSLLKEFNEALVTNQKLDWPSRLDHLKPLARLRENPSKVPCALIGWFALKDAVTKG